jgi:hypothetical protein
VKEEGKGKGKGRKRKYKRRKRMKESKERGSFVKSLKNIMKYFIR